MSTIVFNCRYCSKTVVCENKSNRKYIYCSNSCQQSYQQSMKVDAWLLGEDSGWTGKTRQIKSFVRRFIKDYRGTACSLCGWDEFHPTDGASLTEIDHIDGDAENCTPDNLRVLCPNCHAKTPTFRTRNKVSKRNRS